MSAEVHHEEMKYAIGQSVSRTEDPKLLRGHGEYTDDLKLPQSSLRRNCSQPSRPWGY